jgi:Fe-Mn family superoxide dismutase
MDIGHQRQFTLPPLPYPETALEPHMSAKTLNEHHGAHHQAYVDKLNSLIEGTDLQGKSLEEILKATVGSRAKDKTTLFNQAGQHWNHSFFWKCMKPGGGKMPSELETRVTKEFGSLEKFQKKFVEAGVSHFGSGWVWLIADGPRISIQTTHDGDTPVAHDKHALLACDLWEHAYYLDYQHARPKFLQAFIEHLANWDHVMDQLR